MSEALTASAAAKKYGVERGTDSVDANRLALAFLEGATFALERAAQIKHEVFGELHRKMEAVNANG